MSGMGKIKIYHNSSCSKSRIALKEITQSGNEFEVINYLEDVPSIVEIKKVLAKLNIKPFELVRKTEKVYIENLKV